MPYIKLSDTLDHCEISAKFTMLFERFFDRVGRKNGCDDAVMVFHSKKQLCLRRFSAGCSSIGGVFGFHSDLLKLMCVL